MSTDDAFVPPAYTVRRARRAGANAPAVDDLVWRSAEVAALSHVHPDSSPHRPAVEARLLHDDAGLFGRFAVAGDRGVVARRTRHQTMVCQDSCVEFFFRPEPAGGYLNFEFSAVGVMLVHWIVSDPARPAAVLTARQLATIDVVTTLEGVIDPPLDGPIDWALTFSIPHELVRVFAPRFDPSESSSTANFYKCADHSPLPHWLAWSDIGEKLSFHQPARFGRLRFVG